MKAPFHPRLWSALALISVFALAPRASAQEVGVFEIHFDSEAFEAQPEEMFHGDVFVAFGMENPRQEMHAWFDAPPVMRFAVEGVKLKDVLRFSVDDAVALHPLNLAKSEQQEWKVQAIARLSRTGRMAGLSDGDVYSEISEIQFVPESPEAVVLRLNQIVREPAMQETERVRLFEFLSPSLSKFHGFDYVLKAGVLLPKDYDPEQSYPVVYSVPGFGGTHTGVRRWERMVQAGSPLERCILVVPDANNRYGHSVFCDSATNGPWGQALVYELIPALEMRYGGAGPTQRYVTGVSSGGWSSLWLQVTYPDQFAGCWSHVPDPIDFHDFQQINLYEPLPDGTPRNMYTDENGGARPVARDQNMVRLTYEAFVRREHVLNPGGQIRSFEATFSPRLPDGTPRRVFDVETGAIDHETAKAWRKYDLSNTLLTRWEDLRPSLAGKIHIYAGEVDTFYLEGAVQRFQKLAAEKGMLEDMVVEVIPGMAHSLHGAGFQDMEQTIEAGMAVSVGD